MTFNLQQHVYTARDPGTYAVDVLAQENKKKLFIKEHPEAAELPRPEVRRLYEEWSDKLEGTLADTRLTLSTILIPVGDAPDLVTVPDSFILECSSFEVNAVLDFFSSGRIAAYLKFKGTPNDGDTSKTQTAAETDTTITSPLHTKTDSESTSQ
jgi:hypothetical protein